MTKQLIISAIALVVLGNLTMSAHAVNGIQLLTTVPQMKSNNANEEALDSQRAKEENQNS